jgi:small subunit ribosomal protein S7
MGDEGEEKAPESGGPEENPVPAPATPVTPAPADTATSPTPASTSAALPAIGSEPEAVPAPAVPAAPPRPRSAYPLFGRYRADDVVIRDKGLERYISFGNMLVTHSEGRHANRPFGKNRLPVVERLINLMMRTGKFTGKKMKATKVVMTAFEIIERRTKKNPLQVLIDAIEHAAPREEVTRLQFGGVSVPKAVDVAPARRVDLAIRRMALGATKSMFNTKSKRRIEDALANEIIAASEGKSDSFAVSKKEEIERVASSAR